MAGQETISTRLEITGEAAYKQKLKEISLAMKGVNSEAKVTNAAFGKADRSVERLTKAYAQMESRLTIQRQKMAAIEKEYKRIVEDETANSESARKLAADYNYASAAATRMERELEELNKELTVNSSGWNKAIRSAEAIQKKYEKLGNTMQRVGNRVRNVTLAASSAVIGASAKSYMELADAMAITYTIADEKAVPMEEMMQATLAASNDLGVAAKELANAEYEAISAGVDTAETVDFVTVAAKGAKAGLSDVTTVVDASTSVINAWGYAWSDATRIMDKMLVAQEFGKTTVDQISQSIGNLTGLAPQLNMSYDEILAAVAAMTKNGVGTAQAMTGLRGVLSAVLKPTAEAAKMAESLGLEFNAAAMQSKGFAGFLEDVLEKTGGNSEMLAVLFGQVEGLSAVMSLAGSAAGDFAYALDAMENSAGVLDEQFAIRMDSPAQRFEKAINRMRNAAISFGQTLAPYIDIAAGSIEKLGETLGNLSGDQQMAIVKTAAWVAGISSAVSVAGKLLTSLKALATAGKLVFSGPVGWVVGGALAVGGLTAAMIKLADSTKDVDEVWSDVQGKFDDQMARDIALTIGADVDTSPATDAVEEAIKAMSGNILTQLTDGLPDSAEVVSQLKSDVSTKFQTLIQAVEEQLAADLAALNPDDADYQQQCAAIITEAENTKAELAAMEQEYYTFIDTYAGKSAATVKAHVDELETLDGKVLKLTEDIEAYNNAQKSAGAASFDVVTAGATTDTQTIAESWQYAYQSYKLALQKYESQRDAEIADLNARFADKTNKMTDEQYRASLEGIKQLYDENVGAEELKWKKMAEGLLKGMEEGFAAVDPESVDLVSSLAEKLDLAGLLQSEFDKITYDESARFDTDAISPLLQKYFESAAEGLLIPDYESTLLTGGPLATRLVSDVIAMINEEVKSETENLDENPYVELLNAIFSSDAGSALGVDTTSMESVLSAAAGDLSTATIDGYTKGIEDGTTDVETATAGMMESGIDAAKGALDSHSPSRVYRELGHNAIDGMILGLQDRRGRLVSVMQQIARAAVDVARKELDIHSPSRVMYDMGMQTAQGYINAINAQVSEVERAMKRLSAPRAAGLTIQGAPAGGNYRGMENVTNNVNVHYSAPYGRKEALRFGNALAKGMVDAKKAYGG